MAKSRSGIQQCIWTGIGCCMLLLAAACEEPSTVIIDHGLHAVLHGTVRAGEPSLPAVAGAEVVFVYFQKGCAGDSGAQVMTTDAQGRYSTRLIVPQSHAGSRRCVVVRVTPPAGSGLASVEIVRDSVPFAIDPAQAPSVQMDILLQAR